VAACFVHARHARRFDLPRFAGWWGHDKATRFEMGPRFSPMPGAEGWQLSNPPILSLAPLIASLEIFARAGLSALREKSLALTGFLDCLLRERLANRVEILTPRDPASHGCQLSLKCSGGRSLHGALERHGIVGDWREPDVIRVAPVPSYNTFGEVFRFAETLGRLVAQHA
jgi:kynureninase